MKATVASPELSDGSNRWAATNGIITYRYVVPLEKDSMQLFMTSGRDQVSYYEPLVLQQSAKSTKEIARRSDVAVKR